MRCLDEDSIFAQKQLFLTISVAKNRHHLQRENNSTILD